MASLTMSAMAVKPTVATPLASKKSAFAGRGVAAVAPKTATGGRASLDQMLSQLKEQDRQHEFCSVQLYIFSHHQHISTKQDGQICLDRILFSLQQLGHLIYLV